MILFFGIYLFIAAIFLFFSIMNIGIYFIQEKKRKSDFIYGIFFMFMFLSYLSYSLSKGVVIGETNISNTIGSVFDLLSVLVIICGLIYSIKNNKTFYKKLLFKK